METLGPHQRQYLHISENIPEETQISLVMKEDEDVEPFNFEYYSTREDLKRSQFISLLSILSLLYDTDITQRVVVLGGPNMKAIEYLDSLFPGLVWDIYLMPRSSRKRNIKNYTDTIDKNNFRKPKYNVEVIFFSFVENLESNQAIYTLIKPNWALLPFNVIRQEFSYFDGHILNKVWNKRDSNWSNLLVTGNSKTVPYDKDFYDNLVFRFNYDLRARSYPTYVINNNFDRCYDCAMENSIWELYLLKMGRQADKIIIANYMNILQRVITDS